MPHIYPKGCVFNTISDIKDKKITIMGLGLNGGGEACVRFLQKAGAKLTVTDMKSEKVQNTLNSVSELAGKIQVSGVPTLVFNNKILQTLDASVIQEAIDAAK